MNHRGTEDTEKDVLKEEAWRTLLLSVTTCFLPLLRELRVSVVIMTSVV